MLHFRPHERIITYRPQYPVSAAAGSPHNRTADDWQHSDSLSFVRLDKYYHHQRDKTVWTRSWTFMVDIPSCCRNHHWHGEYHVAGIYQHHHSGQAWWHIGKERRINYGNLDTYRHLISRSSVAIVQQHTCHLHTRKRRMDYFYASHLSDKHKSWAYHAQQTQNETPSMALNSEGYLHQPYIP